MKAFVLAIFATVYAGMILGGLPRLALDRTGVALLGAIALLAGGAMTLALSNLVSNVPAVMLLLPHAQQPAGGPLLALASTLTGNLLLVGSIANLIVVDAASRHGIPISWRRHARTGPPITS